MARLARLVVPGMPHHVTQRGNRRQQTFFNDGDYAAYRELMAQWCREYAVEIWGYCLMPNHVHLIAVPSAEDGLRLAIGEAHERYTRRINFRERWRGYLWQGRFASFVMDEPYLLAAAGGQKGTFYFTPHSRSVKVECPLLPPWTMNLSGSLNSGGVYVPTNVANGSSTPAVTFMPIADDRKYPTKKIRQISFDTAAAHIIFK
jgi:REP element-mobilizing transposase RayT